MRCSFASCFCDSSHLSDRTHSTPLLDFLSSSLRVKMSSRKAHYVNGYPELASFIATDRDRTTLIFKRFDRLAARNLLHLQSELARLQAKLDRLDQPSQEMGEDIEQMLAAGRCLRNWETFKSAAEQSVQEQERLVLYKDIQMTLKDYSKRSSCCVNQLV